MISESTTGLRYVVFNHDGFGLLAELAGTDCTPAAADRALVAPLAAAGFTAIDWCLCSTGIHNCRTRHGRGITRALLERSHADNPAMWGAAAGSTIFPIGDVVERYNAQEQDLLDCVIAAGHARGLRVYGNVRLNHACVPCWLEGVPGSSHAGGVRKDFRDEAFQAYLLELFEDLLAKGVDGLSLDFERKAPFFPSDTPQEERFEACCRFLRRIRALTDKPVIARVAYEADKGARQGQNPEGWLREGLLDAIVPATHNHEPDGLDWSFERFVKAAAASPRPCAVWPQIWPTPETWREPLPPRHTPEAIVARARALFAAGADGVYFFNMCCYWPRTGREEPKTEAMFRAIRDAARPSRETLRRLLGLPAGQTHPIAASMRKLDAFSLGLPASRGGLAPETRGAVELGDGTVVEKWLYTAEPGSRIPANLYRPARVVGRLPAIVMTCGHGDSKSLAHMQYVARTYARAGVACLLADPLGEEERHPQGGLGTREHDEAWVVEATQTADRPVMGKLVFDAMRGLDFLESLDWVDPARLGVAGNSLGGAVAGWVWALEPRLRLAMVSGWAFGDYLCTNGKHCTNWPNQRMREGCGWPEYLRLGMAHAPLLILNGAADVILDRDGSGTIWREMETALQEADPDGTRIQMGWFPGGGHRPYHGSTRALQFIHEQLGTPGLTPAAIDALPELHYGTWCDRHGVALEALYGVELHYRGARLPDLGFAPIPRADLAVLRPEECGATPFTTEGWLIAGSARVRRGE